MSDKNISNQQSQRLSRAERRAQSREIRREVRDGTFERPAGVISIYERPTMLLWFLLAFSLLSIGIGIAIMTGSVAQDNSNPLINIGVGVVAIGFGVYYWMRTRKPFLKLDAESVSSRDFSAIMWKNVTGFEVKKAGILLKNKVKVTFSYVNAGGNISQTNIPSVPLKGWNSETLSELLGHYVAVETRKQS